MAVSRSSKKAIRNDDTLRNLAVSVTGRIYTPLLVLFVRITEYACMQYDLVRERKKCYSH